MQETQVQFWVKKIPWRKKWQHIPTFLPGKDRGAWQATVHGVAESNTTEWLSTNPHIDCEHIFNFFVSCSSFPYVHNGEGGFYFDLVCCIPKGPYCLLRMSGEAKNRTLNLEWNFDENTTFSLLKNHYNREQMFKWKLTMLSSATMNSSICFSFSLLWKYMENWMKYG